MADRAGSPAASLGATFAGKYRLVQHLRTGGVAHVYLAERLTLRPPAAGARSPDAAHAASAGGRSPDAAHAASAGGRSPDAAHTGQSSRFALKVLRSELAHDRAMVRRFERGVLAASRVVHPNVARVGVLERLPDGVPFCTMELLVGLDLADTLAVARRLDPKRAVHIAEGIAAGLAAAHDEGVVHLDVKPENVFLVHRADGHEIVKLLDFGLEAAYCTPEYMAPEQRRGGPASPAMDVYALGATLFEMLTGHPPSAAAAPWPGAPPSKDIPAKLARVLDRALARDPEARFASMTELRAALASALDEPSPSSGALAAATSGPVAAASTRR